MTKNNEGKFSTKDLHFAAFLNLSGVEIIDLERREGDGFKNPVYFIFTDRDKCVYLEKVFWSGEGEEIMINAKKYVDIIRDLRARTSSSI